MVCLQYVFLKVLRLLALIIGRDLLFLGIQTLVLLTNEAIAKKVADKKAAAAAAEAEAKAAEEAPAEEAPAEA